MRLINTAITLPYIPQLLCKPGRACQDATGFMRRIMAHCLSRPPVSMCRVNRLACTRQLCRNVSWQPEKSTPCFGTLSGTPLTEYATEQAAEEGAVGAKYRYGSRLVPYKCRKCHLWHLAPEDRQTPSEECKHCVSFNGRLKRSYWRQRDAERRAQILFEEKHIVLHVYKCEHGSGWHLTRVRDQQDCVHLFYD